jgi:pectate lyase
MKNPYKTIIFFGVVVLMLNGYKVTQQAAITLNHPQPGTIVRVASEGELHQAILKADPDETILIEDGIYNLTREILIENKAGLTLRGASAEASKVILQGGGWGDFYHDRESYVPNNGIVIRNSENITITDLTITEVSRYGILLDAETAAVRSNPKNIHIHRCNFMNIGVRAIKGTASRDQKHLVGGSVRSCKFENTKVPDSSWLFQGDYISAIDMMYLKDWVFSDNVFYNVRGANGGGRGAIFIWNQSRSILVERNVFVGCDRSISFGNPSEPTLYEPGTLHNYDGMIRNNFIVAGHERGCGIEVIWADNIHVCHNTVYSPSPKYRAIRYFQKISRLHIANNLVAGGIFGEEGAQSEGNFTGDLDGYFVSPAVGDLHLTARALEAFGKGIPINCVLEDIDGYPRKIPPDVGADEWQ